MQKKNAAFRKTRRRPPQRKRLHNHRLHEPVSQQVIQALVSGITDLRDRAMILVLTDTGARVSELLELNRDGINVTAGSVGRSFEFAAVGTIPFLTKGKKSRHIYLSARAVEALNAYLETRTDSNPALFTTENGQRMTTQYVRRALRVWCERLDVERFPVHDLRRRFAENLVRSQVSIHAIATVLGFSIPTVLHKSTIRLNLVTFADHKSTATRDRDPS